MSQHRLSIEQRAARCSETGLRVSGLGVVCEVTEAGAGGGEQLAVKARAAHRCRLAQRPPAARAVHLYARSDLYSDALTSPIQSALHAQIITVENQINRGLLYLHTK
jgi:hypothetical protein